MSPLDQERARVYLGIEAGSGENCILVMDQESGVTFDDVVAASYRWVERGLCDLREWSDFLDFAAASFEVGGGLEPTCRNAPPSCRGLDNRCGVRSQWPPFG